MWRTCVIEERGMMHDRFANLSNHLQRSRGGLCIDAMYSPWATISMSSPVSSTTLYSASDTIGGGNDDDDGGDTGEGSGGVGGVCSAETRVTVLLRPRLICLFTFPGTYRPSIHCLIQCIDTSNRFDPSRSTCQPWSRSPRTLSHAFFSRPNCLLVEKSIATLPFA